MSHLRHRLLLNVVFPEGLSPGEGSEANVLTVSRDGQGRPVLRGSAIAGALRHAWTEHYGRLDVDEDPAVWFGVACKKAQGDPSPLRVLDSLIRTGAGPEISIRVHNAIDRHTGAVLDKGLFAIESIPPGSGCRILLILDSDRVEAPRFIEEIVSLFATGLLVGGRTARGIGRAQLDGPAKYKCFDLSLLDEYCAWLDEQYKVSLGEWPSDGEELFAETVSNVLRVKVTFQTPRGQDVLPGDGQGLDFEMQPKRVVCADGKERYVLSGSALRGVLRAWMTRLAARDGLPIADTVKRHLERVEKGEKLHGDELGWGFESDEKQRRNLALAPHDVECPIMNLFGSCYQRGRIHVADAIGDQPCGSPEASREEAADTPEQMRMHVAVDRFSGGATESLLFDNTVLTNVRFSTVITLESPEEREVRWLAGTLRAIDMGILRVGSSKSAGRLALARVPEAEGPYAELLEDVVPAEI